MFCLYITATNFGQNKIRQDETYKQDYTKIPNADSPNLVATKIAEAIETEKAEVFVHEWIGEREN